MVPRGPPLVLNAGRRAVRLSVTNLADRPIQVGSHYPFMEANKLLRFDRALAYGMRLNVPSGAAVRFEPGETKAVVLVAIGGHAVVYGCAPPRRAPRQPPSSAVAKAACRPVS